MKKFIFFIFFIFFIVILISSIEFYIYAIAGNNIKWSEISSYKNETYYHIYVNEISPDVYDAYINYCIGDSIISTPKQINSTGNSPYSVALDSDTLGRGYIAWADFFNGKSSVFFERFDDTSFVFYNKRIVDSMPTIIPSFVGNIDIDVLGDGNLIFIAWNRLYFTDVGDSIVIDSVFIEYSYSNDGGNTFSSTILLNTAHNFSLYPYIAINPTDSIVYITYNNIYDDTTRYIFYDYINAPYFQANQTISLVESNFSLSPVLHINNDTIFCLYSSLNKTTGAVNIKLKRFDDPNLYMDSIFISPSFSNQSYPQMTFDNTGKPIIVYYDSINNTPVEMFAIWDSVNGVFNIDWILWYGEGEQIKRPEIVYVNPFLAYINMLYKDKASSTIYSYGASTKPDVPPPSPQNLQVNDTTFFLWYNNSDFKIAWTNPYDVSSIYRARIKTTLPPVNNDDTSFTIIQDTQFLYNTLKSETLYIWLEDYKGNTDFTTNKIALLKFDNTPPSLCNKIFPQNNDTVYNRDIRFLFNSAIDTISGIKNYSCYFDTNAFLLTALEAIINDTVINFDTSYIDYPFEDGFYYWNAIAKDSADNTTDILTNIYAFYLKATPQISINMIDNDTIDLPYSINFNSLNDYEDNIQNYNIKIFADTSLNILLLDSNFGNSYNDTIFVLNEKYGDSMFIQISGINERGFLAGQSDIIKTYIKNKDFNLLNYEFFIRPINPSIGDSLDIKIVTNFQGLNFDSSYIISKTMDKRYLNFESLINEDTVYIAKTSTEGNESNIIEMYVFLTYNDKTDTIYRSINIQIPQEWLNKKEVFLWPNPVNEDIVNLRLNSAKNANIYIQIFSLKGYELINENNSILAGETKDIQLDISKLNADLYFVILKIVSINDNETIIIKRKFVKIK